MPFEVFRRHQRKLLAIFAIMAMFGFVVSDSLPKLLSPNYGGRDQPIATLDGKTVYRSALQRMLQERTYANLFVSELSPYIGRTPFGGVKDRDLIDALILEREANRLGMPATPQLGRDWLKRITNDRMNRETFEFLLARMNTQVSGEQLLAYVANQVRLAHVRQLFGAALVTPYDVFRAYRDQNERVSAKIVEVPVEKFLAKVREPSPQEIEEEYDRYKDALPDPARETPGFKVPRQIQVEILSVDGNALARSIKDKLTESELRTAYENRKSEFREQSELPDDLFAGQPELTPPIQKPFADVRADPGHLGGRGEGSGRNNRPLHEDQRRRSLPRCQRIRGGLRRYRRSQEAGNQVQRRSPDSARFERSCPARGAGLRGHSSPLARRSRALWSDRQRRGRHGATKRRSQVRR